MNLLNERQHYISQALLKRFRKKGEPLQCYDVHAKKWIPRSVENACSAGGYNQLLISGVHDNCLEQSFSKVESLLPKTLRALENAAESPLTELPLEIYANMCHYCAFLKLSSLFAKTSSIVTFVAQVNLDLELEQYSMLRELGFDENAIQCLRQEHLNGKKIILAGENLLQLFYRYHFSRSYNLEYAQFFQCHWKIFRSEIDFPISDMGLVPTSLTDEEANLYVLPIAPRFILRGRLAFNVANRSSATQIKAHDLSAEESEYLFDMICSSAVSEVVASCIDSKVEAQVAKRTTSNFKYTQVVNPELAKSSGVADGRGDFKLLVVSEDEYVRFVHSYIQPLN